VNAKKSEQQFEIDMMKQNIDEDIKHRQDFAELEIKSKRDMSTIEVAKFK
jgi:hypothetical protein